jgi:hypothetical protein
VVAVLKTSLTESQLALNMVVVRHPLGGWTSTIFGRVTDHHTRPILLLDEQNGRVYVFATNPESGGAIYYKSAPVSSLQFEPGLGTPFIRNPTDVTINNATSTKQNLDSRTGLVVLASDQNTRFYLHNFLELGAETHPPVVHGFSPTSGPAGTAVVLTGENFTGTTSVRFNGTAASFSVASGTRIDTAVPTGATSGRIGVTTPSGTATSAMSFIVTHPPTVAAFSPSSGPVGTPVTVTGSHFSGAASVHFNGAAAQFSVVSDGRIDARVPAGATTGRISVATPAGTASSATAFRVTRPPVIQSFTPSLGIVLTPVTIHGRFFTGATSVKFSGVHALFTVLGDETILTAVPFGARSGKIEVTTAEGSGMSATDFTLLLGL